MKEFNQLSEGSQRVFVVIEMILDRYLTDTLHIPKWDLLWECNMARTQLKNALRELKKEGYIVAKNANSSTISIGEEYRIGGKNGEENKAL